jgi:hypothetical protein
MKEGNYPQVGGDGLKKDFNVLPKSDDFFYILI